EAVPVGLDLGTVGDIETDRAEDFLDSRPGAADRMKPASAAPAPRKRDVERLAGELRLHAQLRKLRAPVLERFLEPRFRLVDRLAGAAPFVCRELAQSFEQRRQLTALAEVARLCVFESRRIARRREVGERPRDNGL